MHDTPKAPDSVEPALEAAQPSDSPQNRAIEGAPTAAATGRRASFRDIRRQLTDEDLKQPGVQKLLIEDFERAESECEAIRTYIDKFHEADKQLAVLKEKLKFDTALEIITGVGLAAGSAIVGLAPSFWAVSGLKGQSALAVGALLVIGAIVAKFMQRSK